MRIEEDGWGPGPNILADESLARLRSALDETPLIVEHRFYRGASAPARRIFEDPEELELYLRMETRPGDSIWVWCYANLCRDDNALTHAKCPDGRGDVPARGAY